MAKFKIELETKFSNGDLVLYRIFRDGGPRILGYDYYVLFRIVNTEIRTFEGIPFVKEYHDIQNVKNKHDIIDDVLSGELIKYNENNFEEVKTDIISSYYKIFRKKAE